ncbi:MAG: hypothetical protein AAF670_07710 [Planctomycetota bacterium]
MFSRPDRIRLLIDRDVQMSLIIRGLLYTLACLIYFVVIELFSVLAAHPGATTGELIRFTLIDAIYWVPGLLVLGPLMVHDMLRHSNRLAGPIFSLRREIRRLVANDAPSDLKFRGDDHWQTMANDFNQLRQIVQDLRSENEELRNQRPERPDSAEESGDASNSLDDSPMASEMANAVAAG